jgi:hypothetical protein
MALATVSPPSLTVTARPATRDLNGDHDGKVSGDQARRARVQRDFAEERVKRYGQR